MFVNELIVNFFFHYILCNTILAADTGFKKETPANLLGFL